MSRQSETVAIWMRVRAVILWLGGSAAIGSLALVFWYRMTLKRFQEAGDDPNRFPSAANEDGQEVIGEHFRN